MCAPFSTDGVYNLRIKDSSRRNQGHKEIESAQELHFALQERNGSVGRKEIKWDYRRLESGPQPLELRMRCQEHSTVDGGLIRAGGMINRPPLPGTEIFPKTWDFHGWNWNSPGKIRKGHHPSSHYVLGLNVFFIDCNKMPWFYMYIFQNRILYLKCIKPNFFLES